MKKERKRIEGMWVFIGAERYDGIKWHQNEYYTKDMTWVFIPYYYDVHSIIGRIRETTTSNHTELSFCYNTMKQLLSVEIRDDDEPSTYQNPQTDIYEVVFVDNDTITISILNEFGCPPPYFRYILHRNEK